MERYSIPGMKTNYPTENKQTQPSNCFGENKNPKDFMQDCGANVLS